MGIQHYFSKDEDKRAKFIFNFIAPFYKLIDNATASDYSLMADLFNSRYPIFENSILDIGTGTGSWIAALNNYKPIRAVGVDFSEKMLQKAQEKYNDIHFLHQNGESLANFDDNSFDMVTATFVLHGMKSNKREKLLKEMKRVAKKYVIIHDFYNNHQKAVKLLEFLERSDYHYFQKHFRNEILNHFHQTEIIEGQNGNALYVGIL